MASTTNDLATITYGIDVLGDRCGKPIRFTSTSPAQADFVKWALCNIEPVRAIRDLKALAAFDIRELNQFLVENGCQPYFRSLRGVGVASILDMLAMWQIPGTVTSIKAKNGGVYDGFEIVARNYYDVGWYEHPLVQVLAHGSSVWFLPVDTEPKGPQALFEVALKGMHKVHDRNRILPGHYLRAPMVDLWAQTSTAWLHGLVITDVHGRSWSIDDALQTVRIRMNETGASGNVVTNMSAVLISQGHRSYTIDRPFVMWFTQENSRVPIAPAYVDHEAWCRPISLT